MNYKKSLISVIFLSGLSITSHAWIQPTPDAECPITDISSTQNGDAIGVRNYGCDDNGVNVVWSVSIPDACTQGGCGLIIDIHGATMNAEGENKGSKLREYGLNAVSRGADTPYIVAQPSLTDLFDWHEGLNIDIESVFAGAYLNELPSMEAFIDDAIIQFDIDPSRIHMYGFSRGTHTTNEFYCDEARAAKYASFSMHGEKLKCDIQKNKPLLLTNGIYDFLTPNQQSGENKRVMGLLRDGGFNESLITSEQNWENPDFEWSTLLVKGKYEHRRFLKGGEKFWFESIEHSGKSFPLFGHCHPVTSDWGFLRCYTSFNIGEKVIDFFIAHPKK